MRSRLKSTLYESEGCRLKREIEVDAIKLQELRKESLFLDDEIQSLEYQLRTHQSSSPVLPSSNQSKLHTSAVNLEKQLNAITKLYSEISTYNKHTMLEIDNYRRIKLNYKTMCGGLNSDIHRLSKVARRRNKKARKMLVDGEDQKAQTLRLRSSSVVNHNRLMRRHSKLAVIFN